MRRSASCDAAVERAALACGRRRRRPSAARSFGRGHRTAKRAPASVDTIVVAQRRSSAAAAGRQTKMRRRLGVSPGPVGLNGPAIVDAVDAAGCRRSRPRRCPPSTAAAASGFAPPVFSTNVTPMVCGPALTGTRACSRASKLSAERRVRQQRCSSPRGPPTVARNTRTPSTLNSTSCGRRQAAREAVVGAVELRAELRIRRRAGTSG